MKYHILLWDVDGTLLDFNYSEKMSLKECFKFIGVDMTDEMLQCYHEINISWWKRLELGQTTKKELLLGRFTELFSSLSMENVDVLAFQQHYQQLLGSIYSYVEDSLSLCQRIEEMSLQSGERVRQYVVTNGVAKTQRNKLQLSGFDKIMDEFFISEELGAVKPDRLFFDACFKEIPDFVKEETLIIGDSLSSDMKGGNQAGIATCWYNPNGEVNKGEKTDYEIQSLWEILKLLEK